MSSPKAGRGQGKFPSNVGQKVGIEVFRIENMNPVLIDAKEHGNFYGGDCYIILHTYEVKNSRSWNLHFWLGDESSKDEHGAVAYRTVELDDLLGGKPVQMRHTQGHESNELVSLFKSGIKVMKGGVDSAFTKVDPDKYDPRLFHLKGKRTVTVKQVELKSSCLNHGDCFILDLGKKVFQWNGKDANKYEKVKALATVTEIRNQHGGPGKCELFILEGTASATGSDLFWKTLGDAKHIKSAEEGGSDDEAKQAPPKLFQVSDASGKLEVTLVGEGKLEKKMLDEKDCFILDTGNEIHVWVGKQATKQERAKSMEHAAQYIQDNKLPAWLPISRVGQGGESNTFKGFFTWPADVKKSTEKKEEKKKDDTSALGSKQTQEEEKLVDKGDGKVDIFRINNFKKESVPKEDHGQFYSGDSYIVLYSYSNGTKPAWVIYFWQGKHSSQDEKGASALLAKDMDDERGGEPVQVRVEEGKEPKHFQTLFKGKMIIHQGGHASAFKNKKGSDTSSSDSDAARLYHIKSTTPLNCCASETETALASHLNSGDVFGLVLPKTVYIWSGKYSSKDENTFAASSLKTIQGDRKVVTIAEGSEPEDFWTALGGKTEYATFKQPVEGQREPRLFQCSNVSGAFKVTEVHNFTQEDLINDDVMILDVFTEILVWIGKDSQKEEKDKALSTAMEFVKNATDGRDKQSPVWKVNAGVEPPNFTAHFQSWDSKKAAAAGGDVYAKALADAKASGGEKKVNTLVAASASDIGYLDWHSNTFPIEKLVNGVTLPDKVEAAKRELYLTDSEFEKLFKVKKDAWLSQPGWKRDQAKKQHKLF